MATISPRMKPAGELAPPPDVAFRVIFGLSDRALAEHLRNNPIPTAAAPFERQALVFHPVHSRDPEEFGRLVHEVIRLSEPSHTREPVILVSDWFCDAFGKPKRTSAFAHLIRAALRESKSPVGLVAVTPNASQSPLGRLRDVDAVATLNSLAAEPVHDAVRRTAAGLWFKLPVVSRKREPKRFRVQIAQNCEELRHCLALRHRVYGAMGYLTEAMTSHPGGIEMDRYDVLSVHLAVIDSSANSLAGTMRVVLPMEDLNETLRAVFSETVDAHCGWCREIALKAGDAFYQAISHANFPPLPVFGSQDFKQRWKEMLRHIGDLAEFSRLIVAPAYRGYGLSALLLRAGIALAWRFRRKSVLLECIPAHVAMYEKHGFRQLEGGVHGRDRHLDQFAVGLSLELQSKHPLVMRAEKDIDRSKRRVAEGSGLLGPFTVATSANPSETRDSKIPTGGSW